MAAICRALSSRCACTSSLNLSRSLRCFSDSETWRSIWPFKRFSTCKSGWATGWATRSGRGLASSRSFMGAAGFTTSFTTSFSLGAGMGCDCVMLGFRMGFCGGRDCFTGAFGASLGFSAMGFMAGLRTVSAGFSRGFSAGGATIGFIVGFSTGFSVTSVLSRIAASVSSSFFIRSSSFCCLAALESSFFDFLSNKPIPDPDL